MTHRAFEWIHHHHDSPELEHARHRQEVRDATVHHDPLEEVEYLDRDGIVVMEISTEEFGRMADNCWKHEAKKRLA